ncbi:MAG: hypothetical protein KatS3mg097_470 [Candidatus Parcubacteria bacterium]|nr:MAG: hypothetical protein KatS3mg097_470 [Candidatus Parcubacteria bacterium]
MPDISTNIKNIIPVGLVFPFLLILIIEFGIDMGLQSYNSKLENTKNSLINEIKDIKNKSGDEINKRPEFNFFSRFVNVATLIKERKRIKDVIDSFNRIMPTFVDISNFNYDAEKQQITFQASVSNWRDYVRLYKYLYSQNKIRVESFSLPTGDEATGKINFSIAIILNSNFFEK